MKVYLAGYNVDYDVLREVKSHKDFAFREDITPETISASYARISRDPSPVNEIREKTRNFVANARKSNEKIIFGLGHSSVAEHAVFNFDIIGISRILSEYVEKFRLVSYTEKSQRYITIGKDFVVPEEFEGQVLDDYNELIGRSFEAYKDVIPSFVRKIQEINRDNPEIAQDENLVTTMAKEDARYLLLMGTQTQLGMTINARNLENMISYLASVDLLEAKTLAKNIYKSVETVAPSVIKYCDAKDCYSKIDANIADYLSKNFKISESSTNIKDDVQLIDLKKDFEDRFFAYLLVYYKNMDLKKALYFAKSEISPKHKKAILELFFKELNFYDNIPRIFELLNFTFEIGCSAACYGQLKRHRMATNLYLPYNPAFGTTMPEMFIKSDKRDVFNDIINLSSKFYKKYFKDYPLAVDYFLTNSHKRKVIFQLNFRELYHFCKLRLDTHSQWDIRRIAEKMVYSIKNVSPLFASILGGKQDFQNISNRIADSEF